MKNYNVSKIFKKTKPYVDRGLCSENMGEYTNSIDIVPPKWWKSKHKWFSVDPCISGEVVDLMSKGIHTLASCCGHGKLKPTIIVVPKDIEKMISMGYQNFVLVGENKKYRKDIFIAKSKCRREIETEQQLTKLYLSI